MGRTTIEWTRNEDGTLGRNWNVTRGCSRISPGCLHCYAERIAERFCDGPRYEDTLRGTEVVGGQPFHTFAERGKGWTRKVALLPEMLAEPLRWRKPSRVFVCSTSDLFNEALPDSAIDAVLAVMLLAHRHTFMVLTKRAARMREYFAAPGLYDRVLRAAGPLRVTFPQTLGIGISNPGVRLPPWIWLGVSVEDQQRADERIPHLLATSAAVRWVSYEPALEAVDFSRWLRRCHGKHDVPAAMGPEPREVYCEDGCLPHAQWIVCGGESGPGARPFELAWARSTIRQCREAGVPCFVKQLGAFATDDERDHDGDHYIVCTNDRKGGDPAEWPEDLRVREFPEVPRG